MKKNIIIITLLISILLLTISLGVNKEEVKEEKVAEKNISLPNTIQAYTYEGEKTDKTYEWLLSNKIVNKITCKNGTIAKFNYEDSSVSLSNIHMPDYCTIDFKEGYLVSLTAGSTGTVEPTTQTTGYNGSVSFTVTSNTESTELTKNTCNGVLSGNTFTISNIKESKSCEIEFKSPTLYDKLLADNPTIQTRSSFSAIFTTTNTGTLYKATESIAGSTAKDVYYFAGDAKNNWVKFGTYKINGPIRGYFGSTSISYREYASMEECTSASSYNYNCSYTWSAGDDIYWRIIRTNHDGSIRLLYAGLNPDTTEGYIGESAFNSTYNDPMYAGYMYGTSGTLASNRTNENNSKIKTYIDNWYSNYLSNYTKYISTEAVYCNDRKAPSYSANSSFNYYINTRLNAGNPTYDCEDIKDAFSGTNNEAKLTYPIGLMTADEITYAGGYKYTSLTSPYAWYYLNSTGGSITGSTRWWLLSPDGWNGPYARSWFVSSSDSPGDLRNNYVGDSNGVRPVISIKSCTLWLSGNGSSSSPYEINLDTDISC